MGAWIERASECWIHEEEMMLNWDKEVASAKVKARLGKLPSAAQVAFAGGALEHALGIVSGTAAWEGAEAVAKDLKDVLEAIWVQVGGGLRPGSVRERGSALARFLPDEDTPSRPGLSDLVDGAIELSKLVDKPTALKALDIASYGYQAVARMAMPGVSGGEAAFVAAERACPECAAELQFQLDYLKRLEEVKPPDRYDQVPR
jgi:hypothetical protein